MKTAWQIEFDFSQARAQAAQLEEIAQRLEDQGARRLQRAREELPAYWSGRSAQLFQSKQEELRQSILESARSLREQAAQIRAIAQRLYEAEQAALAIARNRTYGGS